MNVDNSYFIVFLSAQICIYTLQLLCCSPCDEWQALSASNSVEGPAKHAYNGVSLPKRLWRTLLGHNLEPSTIEKVPSFDESPQQWLLYFVLAIGRRKTS
uniref:Phytosulfokines 2-like n=1 Tax=Rhizophora mucronata TaxID=61149 RepID=A0A2P2L377_RHIMU